jgi:membrane protease YdiL (CAAX protease family)
MAVVDFLLARISFGEDILWRGYLMARISYGEDILWRGYLVGEYL